jgi:preprotein translocase subunit Sss1
MDVTNKMELINNMNKIKWLNTLGLLLGIIGVIIIFFYGPPQPHFKQYLMLENQTPTLEELRKTYNLCSEIGLGFIGLGFIFQLIAVWAHHK